MSQDEIKHPRDAARPRPQRGYLRRSSEPHRVEEHEHLNDTEKITSRDHVCEGRREVRRYRVVRAPLKKEVVSGEYTADEWRDVDGQRG